ncbi:MAG: ECF transporter S component [Promethearchaeota archaeon]
MKTNSHNDSTPDITTEDPTSPQRKIPQTPNRRLTIEIAGAAIFSAASIALSFEAQLIPRIPGWQIAVFDPISILWIIAFLVFGFRAGMITTIIGSLGLFIFDPSGIGPLMKFFASVWFVVLPYLVTRYRSKKFSSDNLQKLSNYIPSMIYAWIIRCAVMLILNYIILNTIFPFWDYMSLEWLGFENTTGSVAVITTVLIINTYQSIADTVIPYLIVFKTPIRNLVKDIY